MGPTIPFRMLIALLPRNKEMEQILYVFSDSRVCILIYGYRCCRVRAIDNAKAVFYA